MQICHSNKKTNKEQISYIQIQSGFPAHQDTETALVKVFNDIHKNAAPDSVDGPILLKQQQAGLDSDTLLDKFESYLKSGASLYQQVISYWKGHMWGIPRFNPGPPTV